MLSYSQIRIALLHLYYKNIPIYNISFDLTIEGPIDIQLLEKSVNYLLYRFPELKTNIKNENNKLVKYYNNHCIKIEVYDNSDGNDQKELDFNNTYLDIENELLLKIIYFKHNNKLLFLFSDILIDGTTIINFFKHLQVIYNSLFYKTISYSFSDIVPVIYSTPSEININFWKTIINNDCITYIYLQENTDSFDENRQRFTIENDDYTKLVSIVSSYSITLFDYFTANFLFLLHILSNQPNITIDTIMGNYDTNNIGLFNNTVLIPTRFTDDILNNTFKNYVKHISKNLNNIKNNIIPLEYLINKLDLENLPDIRIHFEYANKNIDKSITLGDCKLYSNLNENTASTIRQLLILNVCEFSNKIECYFSYKKSAFSLDYINNLIRLLKILVLDINDSDSLKSIFYKYSNFNSSNNTTLYKYSRDKRFLSYKFAGQYPNILYSDFKKANDAIT